MNADVRRGFGAVGWAPRPPLAMRRLLTTALLLASAVPGRASSAQNAPPAGSLVRSGGGPGGDTGESVAEDVFSGETVVVGTFEQTAAFGPGVAVTSADAPAARSDAFVVRYAASGAALWARRMGTGVFNDFGAGVALASPFHGSDAVYVSGYFTGVATFDGGANPAATLTTRNDFDAFLAAYSSAGDLLWVQQAGGAEQDLGRGVAADAFGRVYWAGSFTGTATWGSGTAAQTRTSAGSSDGFLARYTEAGTLDRLLTVGGDESDDLRAVAVFPYSNVAHATGTFRSVARFGATPLQSRGLSDVAVIAVGPDNAVQWARQVGGSGNDYARGLALSRNATVGVGGSFENTVLVGTDVLTSAGFSDAFLALYTFNGDDVRAFRGGGAGFDIATAVAATPLVPIATLGGDPTTPVFVLSGYIDGASTFGPEAVAAQGTDAFAAVYPEPYTAPGPADVFTVGGSGQDRGAGAALGYLGQDLVLTGSYRSTVAFGASTVASAGGADVFVARVPLCPRYSCLPVAGEPGAAAPAARVSVAPNPSRSPAVTLRLAEAAEATVDIVDALGRVVAVLHRGALAAGETRWAPGELLLGGLAPGSYVLRVQGPDVSARQAFVVVR